ncbi:MAG: hypothetical protein AB7J35_12210 [Dehalococcoidia bacterium]
MTYWAQLLHFYQPPTQTHDILVKVAEEAYRPLLKVLDEHENARIAVNVQGVLTELLVDHGLRDIVDDLRVLAEKGRIEFVGSGKFHPILPLIPAVLRVRSIQENYRTNQAAFDGGWKPRGFFPPEMCISAETSESIRSTGHEWFIASGVGCPVEWPTRVIHRVPAGDGSIAVLFRDDVMSNRISFRETDPKRFLDDLLRVGTGDGAYVVTAMDAETFGHHITAWERDFLAAMFQLMESEPESGARMVFPSDLVDHFPAGETIQPLNSSWSTSHGDLLDNNPFPLWKAPGNELHRLQWEYVDHCLALLATAEQHATTKDSRKFAIFADARLQPGLHSCQFWWASRRPMWDVTMVHRGFLMLSEVLLNAGRSINFGSASPETKQEASWRIARADDVRRSIEKLLRETEAS